MLGSASHVLGGRESGELTEIVDEMGLVVVSTVQRHIDPVNVSRAVYGLEYPLESSDPAKRFRCQARGQLKPQFPPAESRKLASPDFRWYRD